MNSPFLEYHFKCYLPVYRCILLKFLKLYKTHFSIQNCDLKIKRWIKLIRLCGFKYKFGNLRLFYEEDDPEIMCVLRVSDAQSYYK